jgi:hypothetical protein
MQAALKLEPLSPIINSDFCELLYTEEKFVAAISQCRKTLEMDPDYLPVRGPLEYSYLAQNEFGEAAQISIEGALKSGRHPEWPAQLRSAYHSGGIKALLDVELKHQMEIRADVLQLATAQLRLGRKEDAMQTVLAGYRARDFFLPWVACRPDFAPLRSDARFLTVLRAMGLS